MSKLPMESRPLRLAPDVAKVVEKRLQPLSGAELDRAQQAVLTVYSSGKQMPTEQWMKAYDSAITAAIKEKGK